MTTNRKKNRKADSLASDANPVTRNSKALPIAESGVDNSDKMIRLQSALLADLMTGAVTPRVAQVMTGVARVMLRTAELTLRYGTAVDASKPKVLQLGPPTTGKQS